MVFSRPMNLEINFAKNNMSYITIHLYTSNHRHIGFINISIFTSLYLTKDDRASNLPPTPLATIQVFETLYDLKATKTIIL